MVGKIDSNAIFAVPDGSGDFFNPSFAMSPTMLAMPTYPDPAFGAVLSVFPAEWVYARFGVFDGATLEGPRTGSRGPATFFGDPGDLYFIAEAGPTWTLGEDRAGRLGMGVWHHTGTFTRADNTLDDGTTGSYLTADQRVWSETEDQGIALFAQYGWADDRISEVAHHLSLGAAWTGAIPSRDVDVLGLGITGALVSDDFLPDDEWIVETFYKAQITGWFYLQPGLQYVLNPGGDSSNDDAVVLGVRAGIAF